MKRISILIVALAVAFYLGGGLAFAQGRPATRPGGGAGAPSTPQGRPTTPPERPSQAGGTPSSNPHTGKASASTGEKKTVEQLLTQNTKLSSRVSTLTGIDAQQACSGFKNLGQCVAAAHVSKNLDIPFADLKTKVTGADSMSLGKAIEQMKPEVNATAEAKKAQKQAKADIKKSES